MEDAETDLGRSNDTSIQKAIWSLSSWTVAKGQLLLSKGQFCLLYSRRGATGMPGLVVAQCMLSYRPVVAIAVILSSFKFMNSVLTVCSSFVGNLIAAGT